MDQLQATLYRAKERSRSTLRELLYFIGASILILGIAFAFHVPDGNSLGVILAGIVTGVPTGLVLWFIYKVLRFAFGG